jgi:Na+-transporting methylmalonyl-CoA/oxaloacetate decarboxylase gamma subunit
MLLVVLLSGNAHSQTDNDPIFNEFARQELADLAIDPIELRNGTLPYKTKKVIHIRRDNYIQRWLSDHSITNQQARQIGKVKLEARIPIIEDPRFHRRYDTYLSLQKPSQKPTQKPVNQDRTYTLKEVEASLDQTHRDIIKKKERKDMLKSYGSGLALLFLFILGIWFLGQSKNKSELKKPSDE